MESHLTSTTSTASSITNSCRLIKEHLESHCFFNHHQGLEIQPCLNQRQGSGSHSAATTSSSFINVFDISDITLSPTKVSTTGYSLWHKHRCCTGIKDSMSITRSLCKHTCKVMVYTVLTSKRRLGPDIWAETLQQVESTKNMMRAIWNTETMCRQKASGTSNCLLFLTGKEARYMHVLF